MPDWLIGLIGTGIGAGSLGLIQFIISHFTESKEHKEERKENVANLRIEIMQHIKDVNDENAAAIEDLRSTVMTLTEDSKERRKYEKAIGESLIALTHDRLVHLGKKYQKRGAITLSEQSNLTMLYIPYHEGLGGNHDGETWYNYCMEDLPVVSEQEAMRMDKFA